LEVNRVYKYQSAKLLKFQLALLLLLLSPLTVIAQSANIIAIEPGSGTPGTTIAIRDTTGSNTGKNCFVTVGSGRAQSLGTMQGVLSYVVPNDLAAGIIISFICTGGADGLRTNTATFTVTALAIIVQPPSQPADADGDGLPDTRDNCPNEAGPLDNNGCPVSAPPPLDSDADGVADNVDACPNAFGAPENNGCPVVVPTQVPALILPSLPPDGSCVIATLDAAPVNVRELATTDSAIVASLDPTLTYAVVGRIEDNSWLQINGGWVAAFVVRLGGDCGAVPVGDGLSNTLMVGEQPPSTLLLPAVQKIRDAAARMQNCPDLFPSVDGLPTFLTLYIVGEPDPCVFAQAELDGLFLSAGQPDPMASLEFDYGQWVNGLCPDRWGVIYDFVHLLNRIQDRSPEVWQDVTSRITEDNICLVLQEFGELSYLNPYVFPDQAVNLIAVAYCTYGYYNVLSSAWVQRMEGFIDFLQIPPDHMRVLDILSQDDACGVIEFIRPIGVLSSGNLQFYTTLADSCGIGRGTAAERAIYNSVREAYDSQAAANLGCAGFDQYTSFPLPADLQPTMPQIAQDADCQGNFRLLASFNGGLNPETVFRLLTSLDPCANAYEYAYYGSYNGVNNLPLPACFQNGDVVIPAPSQGQEATVVNTGSSWRQKLLILDRPLDQICNYMDLNVGSGGFALVPTEDALDLAIVPSATPLGIIAAPTATLPLIVAEPALLPTSPPLLDSSPTPPIQPVDQPPVAVPSTVVPESEPIIFSYSLGNSQNPVVATFLTYDQQGNFEGRYLLTSVRHRFFSIVDRTQLLQLPPDCCPGIRNDLPVSILPGGHAVAYYADDPADGSLTLRVHDGETSAEEPTIRLGTFIADTTYPSVWSPDGQFAVITAANGTSAAPLEGHQLLVFHLGGQPSASEPVLTIENAAAPTISPNGRLLAFDRLDTTGRNIYVRSMNSGEITPITQQPAGSECFGAQFGLDSLTLFFTCQINGETTLYRYGLAGVTPIRTGIANAQNPSPGPEPGFITFDDGQTLYVSRDDGTNARPYAQLEGLSLRGLQWTPPPAVTDSVWLDLSAPTG
jgi:hypothetical protein